MNPDTLVSVHCYAGDADRVTTHLPAYYHHGTHVVILSPADSPVLIPGLDCRQAGERAYIGRKSMDRQIEHLKILLTYPHNFFLLNDSDSFCLSAELPARLFAESENTLWSNEVTEPRPHESPYPKIACQPPYFLTRDALARMVAVAPSIEEHRITPYLDWFMLAMACEAGLKHRSFADLGTPFLTECRSADPWERLAFAIRNNGARFMHPIKTPEQFKLCLESVPAK